MLWQRLGIKKADRPPYPHSLDTPARPVIATLISKVALLSVVIYLRCALPLPGNERES